MEKHTLKSLLESHVKENEKRVMDASQLHEFVHNLDNCEILEEESGYIFFIYYNTKIVLLFSEEYDRMRIISSITSYSDLAPKIKDALMDANFHLTLDARYAVSENILYAAFIHPLSSLTNQHLFSGLEQVYHLAINFGKTYSSAQLAFTKKK